MYIYDKCMVYSICITGFHVKSCLRNFAFCKSDALICSRLLLYALSSNAKFWVIRSCGCLSTMTTKLYVTLVATYNWCLCLNKNGFLPKTFFVASQLQFMLQVIGWWTKVVHQHGGPIQTLNNSQEKINKTINNKTNRHSASVGLTI